MATNYDNISQDLVWECCRTLSLPIPLPSWSEWHMKEIRRKARDGKRYTYAETERLNWIESYMEHCELTV